MPLRTFPKEIEDHKQEWVAITLDDKFVCADISPTGCLEKAKALGYDFCTGVCLMYVPDVWPHIHGSSIFVIPS